MTDSARLVRGPRVGFAVKVLGRAGLPSHDARRWQSDPHLRVSIRYLHAILDYLGDAGIRMYRMATAFAPYASHPELTRFRSQPSECASELAEAGARALTLGVRLSTHPGQYTVLNSEDEATARNAREELEVQAEVLDAMRLGPDAVVVLHVGGAAGGRARASDRFERAFERLSERARERVVLENDDRSFSLRDVTRLAARIGRPVVWDVLHHHCHDPDRIPDDEALRVALSTWPRGVTPKVHFSSPRTVLGERKRKVGRRVVTQLVPPPLRAHADMVDPMSFESFVRDVVGDAEVDVMLEAKGKDVALLRLREQMAARGVALR